MPTKLCKKYGLEEADYLKKGFQEAVKVSPRDLKQKINADMKKRLDMT